MPSFDILLLLILTKRITKGQQCCHVSQSSEIQKDACFSLAIVNLLK